VATTDTGVIIKARRRDLDLTQEALAELAACSVETVKKIEAGTLRPSRQLAHRLADVLQLAPEVQEDFVQKLRQAPSGETDAAPTNLITPLTPLIGRETELADAQKLLERPEVRLLTFIGTGGTGKTRLSQEVAGLLRPKFADGVFFVPLASVTNPQLMLPAVAALLNVPNKSDQSDAEALAAFGRDKQMLLVLDNFEQILAAAPDVATLLEATRHLKLLVTSRAALRVRGEYEFAVGTLPYPTSEQTSYDEIAGFEAVRLFVERAAQAQPGFSLTPENAPTIAAICQKLDGLPLALELAAARTKILPPATLLARLDRRLQVLTGGGPDLLPRQQTLRATLEWSYNLLTPPEQAIFRQLAIFSGGGSLAAVESVVESENLLDGLASLVDKSLVRQIEQSDGTPRFYMLETLREYAQEGLNAHPPELERLKVRHLNWCLVLATATEPKLRRANYQEQLQRLETEHDNFRFALDWALNDPAHAETAARLATSLSEFWRFNNHIGEGRGWLERVRVLPNLAIADRIKLLVRLAELMWEQGDIATVRVRLEECNKLFDMHADPLLQSRCLLILSDADLQQGFPERAYELGSRSVALARESGNQKAIADALYFLALACMRVNRPAEMEAALTEARQQIEKSDNILYQIDILVSLAHIASLVRDYPKSRELCDEAMVKARQLGSLTEIEQAAHFAAFAAYRAGDYARARQLFEESIAISRQNDNRLRLGWGLNHLADVLRCQDDLDEAESLYRQSLTVFEQLGERHGLAAVLHNLGFVNLRQGTYEQSRAHFLEALRLFETLEYTWSIADSLVGLAGIKAALGQSETAAILLRAARATHLSIDTSLSLQDPANEREWEYVYALVGGEPRLEAAPDLSLDEAVKLARAE
jgi:predicted ATPase/DNA-binding XRE family transcriptional regulator/Tfp pilus assembly protein PilF